MGRKKNALRKHEVQEYVPGAEPESSEWLTLSKWISDISDDSNEETEDQAYYDGDGTPETDVISVALGYSVEGTYDPENEAQELIAQKRFKLGQGRKLWHRVTRADGKEQYSGRATVSAIVAGSGEASAYEAFGCTITYDQIPKVTKLDGSNDGGSGEQ